MIHTVAQFIFSQKLSADRADYPFIRYNGDAIGIALEQIGAKMELVYRATDEDHNQRAVDVLTRQTGMSRLMTKKVRLYGTLLCNQRPHRMIDRVSRGDLLVARYPAGGMKNPVIAAQAGIPVLYQDDWVVVVAKPAGLVTHPSFKEDKSALTRLLSEDALHPISRLDRDTTGAVLLGLNGHAHYVVTQHKQTKHYLAVLHGRLPAGAGLIQAPIKRAPDSLIKRMVHQDGAQARTIWRTLGYQAKHDVSLVQFELLTGRTHQIRIHAMACGCPIVGDTLYHLDREPDELDQLAGRQMLHAWQIAFGHPVSRETIRVRAPVPSDMRRVMDYSGLNAFLT